MVQYESSNVQVQSKNITYGIIITRNFKTYKKNFKYLLCLQQIKINLSEHSWCHLLSITNKISCFTSMIMTRD